METLTQKLRRFYCCKNQPLVVIDQTEPFAAISTLLQGELINLVQGNV
jgi:hypothetical protein